MARRKKHEEEHESHERWLVSYSDFMTLLLAFFVVMYALSSINEGKYRIMSSSIMNAFRNGSTIVTTKDPNGSANTMIEIPQTKPIAKAIKGESKVEEQQKLSTLAGDLIKAMDPLLKNGQVKITQSPKGIMIEIRDSALFPVGQAQPGDQSRELMAGVAKLLKNVDNPIRVEGFTDNVPIKNPTYPSNWELSAARAGSVVRIFQENGINPDRMVAVGHGENLPIADNTSNDGRATNRRVSISVLTTDQHDAESIPINTAPAQ